MIMSHQADLVDGCGAGGRPSDYLSSSLSKGTSQCEPQTHVEILRFLRLLSVKMLIVKIVDCRVLSVLMLIVKIVECLNVKGRQSHYLIPFKRHLSHIC